MKNFDIKTREDALRLLENEQFINQCTVVLESPTGEGKEIITLAQLINKIGKDAVAEMLYKAETNGIAVKVESDEAKELLKKITSGESLTELDKEKIQALLNSQRHSAEEASNFIYETLLRICVTEGKETSVNGFVIAVALNLLETLVATSGERMSQFKDDKGTFDKVGDAIGQDILNTWKSSLKESNDLTDDMILLGLVHAIGNHFLTNDSPFATKEVPTYDICKELSLHKNIVYGCGVGKEYSNCDNDCRSCSKVNQDDRLRVPTSSKVSSDILNQILGEKLYTSREEAPTPKENVADIRSRLKNN